MIICLTSYVELVTLNGHRFPRLWMLYVFASVPLVSSLGASELVSPKIDALFVVIMIVLGIYEKIVFIIQSKQMK